MAWQQWQSYSDCTRGAAALSPGDGAPLTERGAVAWRRGRRRAQAMADEGGLAPPPAIEGADGAEPEPEPEEVDDSGAEGGEGSPGTQAELRKSKKVSKYSSGAAANPLTEDGLPSMTSRPTAFPLSLGGDKDGNFRITMDKKSPTAVSAWQKRWCVFTPDGKVYYFDSIEASRGVLDDGVKKDPLDLTQCRRITSNNLASCHVEFDLGGKKSVQLRITKEAMQLPSGSVIKRYDKSKLAELQEVLHHLERTGVLPCEATIEKIGDQTVKKERKELAARSAVMAMPK